MRKQVANWGSLRNVAPFLVSLAIATGTGSALEGRADETAPVETTAVSRISAETKDPLRDPGIFGCYWWANRFLSRHRIVEEVRGKTVDVAMLGDSITHFWEWKHPESWKRFTSGRTVLNLGYGGDLTQTVIWRIRHGELDGYTAKNVVLMIGTNNNSSEKSKPENVALGVEKIVALIREKQPGARIILHPIFPRGASEASRRHAAARARNERTNALLKDFAANQENVLWIDFNARLVDDSGWVPKALMGDEIHPTDAGYEIWMEELSRVL